MIYGQLLQNLEGKFWNPIAFPRLKRTEGDYVLAKLKEAELLFSSIQTRFGSRFAKSASRSEHIQLVCQARTFGQLGNIKKAEETIELACDRLGQKYVSFFGNSWISSGIAT